MPTPTASAFDDHEEGLPSTSRMEDGAMWLNSLSRQSIPPKGPSNEVSKSEKTKSEWFSWANQADNQAATNDLARVEF
jgi:hypothetical protein